MNWAKHNMNKNRNTQYRPEQILLYKQLRATRAHSELLMEYTIKYTDEQDRNMVAIVDIVDLTKREVFRINGAIHNTNKHEDKDWEQKVYLEKWGWKVTDIEV